MVYIHVEFFTETLLILIRMVSRGILILTKPYRYSDLWFIFHGYHGIINYYQLIIQGILKNNQTWSLVTGQIIYGVKGATRVVSRAEIAWRNPLLSKFTIGLK